MDNKFWSFIVVAGMWAGVLGYMFRLNRKVKQLEQMSEDE